MAIGRKAPPRLSALELGRYLGITKSQVNKLAQEEILTREVEGDFIAPNAIKQYYEYKFLGDSQVDYMEEKAKHEAAKRKLTELELGKREKELFEASDVEFVMVDMLIKVRSRLLAIAPKVAPQLSEKDKATQLINREVNDALAELHDYDPNMFEDDGDGK